MQKSKYFGDRAFYKYVLGLAVPIMIQNFITNFLSMLDNLMVGRLGTAAMSGVSVANQLLFVYMLAIFGLVSGAGIFGAQYAGNKDEEGLRYTFRFKVIGVMLFTFLFCWLFAVTNESLISLYLQGTGSADLRDDVLVVAQEYLIIMLLGLYPASLTQAYASTLRETGETRVPMIASIVGVMTNFIGDYLLIFGKLGLPELGYKGAAYATVLARFIEVAILIVWTHTHTGRPLIGFAKGAYKSPKIPVILVNGIVKKGFPLLMNEFLWAAGMTRLTQCYTMRGIDVVAAYGIVMTFWNVFSTVFLSIGSTVGIVIGQQLGANEDAKEIKYTSYKLTVMSLFITIFTASAYIGTSFFVPDLFETTEAVRFMATRLMIIGAITMPADSIANTTYFAIRSGGKTLVTFLMDAGFVWAVCVTTATLLIHVTDWSVYWIYASIQVLYYIKAIVGIIILMDGKWINNLINEESQMMA